jgi:hypothetical protein
MLFKIKETWYGYDGDIWMAAKIARTKVKDSTAGFGKAPGQL